MSTPRQAIVRGPRRAARGRPDAGFTLIESLFALGIMAFGLLTLAAVFSFGLTRLGAGGAIITAKEKAAEAIESVFMARDTGLITWDQVRNVSDSGVFLEGPQPLRIAGDDGLINTADDGPVETTVTAGPDGLIGTEDDEIMSLDDYTRQIQIIDIEPNLREVRVTVHYPLGSAMREFVLVTYMSAFA